MILYFWLRISRPEKICRRIAGCVHKKIKIFLCG